MNVLLRLWVYIVVLACYITVLITFTYAYLNDMRVLITINDYGEAVPELILLASSIPIVLKEICDIVKHDDEDDRKRGRIL